MRERNPKGLDISVYPGLFRISVGGELYKRGLVLTDCDQLTSSAMELEIQNAREQTVKTNIGTMPWEDYREIIAMQNGFDSYADMRSQGVFIRCERESVLDHLIQESEKKEPIKVHKHKEPER